MILISGIPASGKSHFSKWYANKIGFDYRDVDTQGGSITPEDIRSELILDWGFPIQALLTVKNWKSMGTEIWWFDCDRTVAKAVFQKRALKQEQLSGPNLIARMRQFENQMRDIESVSAEIADIFRGRAINTLKPNLRRKSCETIYEEMVSLRQ